MGKEKDAVWIEGEEHKEKEPSCRVGGCQWLVGYTDTPTWICPGDWDQILHLSKATLHQRHSNEVVFYCKLSSRGVCVCTWVCTTVWVSVCAGEGWESEEGERRKNQGMKRLKERCVGLSSLSVSKRGVHIAVIYMILSSSKQRICARIYGGFTVNFQEEGWDFTVEKLSVPPTRS